jgi:hypothetical protein
MQKEAKQILADARADVSGERSLLRVLDVITKTDSIAMCQLLVTGTVVSVVFIIVIWTKIVTTHTFHDVYRTTRHGGIIVLFAYVAHEKSQSHRFD